MSPPPIARGKSELQRAQSSAQASRELIRASSAPSLPSGQNFRFPLEISPADRAEITTVNETFCRTRWNLPASVIDNGEAYWASDVAKALPSPCSLPKFQRLAMAPMLSCRKLWLARWDMLRGHCSGVVLRFASRRTLGGEDSLGREELASHLLEAPVVRTYVAL